MSSPDFAITADIIDVGSFSVKLPELSRHHAVEPSSRVLDAENGNYDAVIAFAQSLPEAPTASWKPLQTDLVVLPV